MKKIIRNNMVLSKIFSVILIIRDRLVNKERYKECLLLVKKFNKNKEILFDVYFCILYYNIIPIEYFLFDFYRLNRIGRKEYIVQNERDNLLQKGYTNDIKELYNAQNSMFVIEEVIDQNKELSEFHPESINTIRFASYYNKKEDKVIGAYAFFRMGVGDSIVDNLSQGGISAIIDIQSGVVITPAKDENCIEYLFHPNTNKQIIGYKIPKWNELLEFINNISRIIPDYPYISWDLALSNKGWSLVEANTGGGLHTIQMHGKGIRKRMNDLMNN